MNEDSGKPERWYKFRDRNDRSSGFLRVFLIVLVIIVVIGILIAVDLYECHFDCVGLPSVYSVVREQIQNALTAYSSAHNGSLPTLSSAYTNANCSGCSVINMSTLLSVNDETLRQSPDGLNLSANGNDNCGGNSSLGCKKGSSYIWIVDTNGTVYSYCAGTNCKTNNSGFQDVWP